MTKSNPDELDFDYAVFVAERAASLMSRLKIAPTPANYFPFGSTTARARRPG
jgi:hypothetical protein